MTLGRFLKSLAFLMSLVLLANCQSGSGQDVDRSILTHAPCAPPCWQGITPGQTTADEAFEILTELGYDPHRGKWGNYITWHSVADYPGEVLERGANSLDSFQIAGPVAYLKIGLEFDLSAQQVLNIYGRPEKYQLYETTATLAEDGHTPILAILFYYVQKGLIFESWVPISEISGEAVAVHADVVLDWIYYIPPTTTQHIIEDNPRLEWVLADQEPLNDWQGFPIVYQRSNR